MARKSIVETSVKMTGDASGVVAEFNRADNASRRAAANIDREVEKMARSMKRKWDLADFSKGALNFAGFGSAFAVAELALTKWIDIWKEGENSAKEMAKSTKEMAGLFAELSNARFTAALDNMSPEKQLDALSGRLQTLKTQAAAFEEVRTKALAGIAWVTDQAGGVNNISNFGIRVPRASVQHFGGSTNSEIIGGRAFFDMMNESAEAAQKQWRDLEMQIVPVQKSIDRLRASLVDKALTGFFSGVTGKNLPVDDATWRANRLAEQAAASGNGLVGQSLREHSGRIDSLFGVQNEMARVDAALQWGNVEFNVGNIDKAGEAWRIYVEQARQAKEVDSDLALFFDDLDEQSKAFDRLTERERLWAEETMRVAGTAADSMTTAWVDAINGVEGAFGNLGNVVTKEIEAMVVRMIAVVPIMQAIGKVMETMGMPTGVGTLAGAFKAYGGGKAAGGDVAAGVTYLVGERGPELFTPRSSGLITPNAKLANLAPGAPSINYAPTYNIQSGVTRADLVSILEAQGKRTISELRDLQRRGKA
jgi:hypothetical protein